MRNSIKQLVTLFIVTGMAVPVFAGDYSTVNDSIRIGEGTTVDEVDSVNGSIRIGDESVARSVNSVNGSIKIGRDVTVERRVEAVNGSITLKEGSQVGDGIETVNGSIELQGTHVAGDVDTVNGGITLNNGTVVAGNVIVSKPKGWGWGNKHRKPVTVELGRDVEVQGDLIFEQPVELRVHESAAYGDIVGDEVRVVDID